MLIPGAYESNTKPYRAAQPVRLVPAAPLQEEVRAHSETAAVSHVVAASAHPASRFGFAIAILGDVALGIAVIFAIALTPILAVQGIRAVVALVLDTFSRP